MAIAALPFIALGSSIAGSIGSGIASADAASYQAQVARNNAQVARQNAAYAAQAGSVQTEEEGMKAHAQEAQAKAAMAANNLDVNTGSAANVEQGNRELGYFDQATVANKAAQAVYGYQTQATNFTSQAQLDQSQVGWDLAGGALKGVGDIAGAAPGVPGISSLLSGSPSVPANYAWMQSGTPLDQTIQGSDTASDVTGVF